MQKESVLQPASNGCYDESSQKWVVCNQEKNFTFWYPSDIEKSNWQDKGVNVYTYNFPLSLSEENEWQSNFGHVSPRNISCSPSLTGASTTTPLPNANGTAEWGRVDFFEKYAGEGYVDYMGETPLCAEPGSAKDRYALCSHKDGKTVVICISQMTQNEPLAKQIFDTFRWTK